VEINNTELELPIKYQRVKLNCDWYCKLKGINRATYFRWKKSITVTVQLVCDIY
jgi:hypothetical protein